MLEGSGAVGDADTLSLHRPGDRSKSNEDGMLQQRSLCVVMHVTQYAFTPDLYLKYIIEHSDVVLLAYTW